MEGDLAGLDLERAQTAAPVLAQSAAAFKDAAFLDTGIEPKIADQLLAGGKTVDIAERYLNLPAT